MTRKILILLSVLFVLFSFTPTLLEIYNAKLLPPNREFTLEHNYMFDYNFYLSRIREGQEGRWTVVEKYYNMPHSGSLFQIFYLFLGKIGALVFFDPVATYHLFRIVLGLLLLLCIGYYTQKLFPNRWSILAFLLVVTASSWPVVLWYQGFWRFGMYMAWWSVMDSLQRITFIPHLLLGQLFILIFTMLYSQRLSTNKTVWVGWGIVGLCIGIIFPPTLIVVYTLFGILAFLEFTIAFQHKKHAKTVVKEWVSVQMPRVVFIAISLPSFIYLQKMFQVMPWSFLALFDIQHRLPLPYDQYALALGPMLPLGIIGLILVYIRNELKLFPMAAWVIAIGLLFFVFERVPQQSPLRFTQSGIHIPLGILATYVFYSAFMSLQKLPKKMIILKKIGQVIVPITFSFVILLGLGQMVSSLEWIVDQTQWKREGTWTVPIGAQIGYQLKDFMDGIRYFKNNTDQNSVVLGYVTAGNYIPAYAGNFVYIGHANTPDEDAKEQIAKKFFSGEMKGDEVKIFLQKERITYIFFGPQERDFSKGKELTEFYPFLKELYRNSQVKIYKI